MHRALIYEKGMLRGRAVKHLAEGLAVMTAKTMPPEKKKLG